MARATTSRWPIEQSFQEGRSELGMDHYELRSWRGWHRHMLYVCLATLFLLEVRLAFNKRGAVSPLLTVAQARRLVAAAFEVTFLPRRTALQLTAYHLRRSDVARMSHYKRKCLQLLAGYLRRAAQLAA